MSSLGKPSAPLGEPWRIALACVTSFFVMVIMLKSSYWSYFTLKALAYLRNVLFSRLAMQRKQHG